MLTVYKSFACVFIFPIVITMTSERPFSNIIFIVADDLGWDDVSFHGSPLPLTPNIDLLAYTGVALNRHYTHCVCTPSRSALLTGKYAHTLGMHGRPLIITEDKGIPLTEKLLPEYLKELGYRTHLVGKWHVGMSRTEYLPTSRGFDTHFGFRGGQIDYYEYVSEDLWENATVAGFDLYRNLTPAWDVKGYLTDVLTEEAVRVIKEHDKSKPLFLMFTPNAPHSSGHGGTPLQAPPEDVRKMRYVESPVRRMFAAMVKKLDESVGEIFNTLAYEGILNNTILVFISDNGGLPTGLFKNFGSNYPLRGMKMTPYEGGIRTTGLLWSPMMTSAHHTWNGYMHISDWLPTLLTAIGADLPKDIDGLDLWTEITSDQPSKREEIIEIYESESIRFNSVINGDYKLIFGKVNAQKSAHHNGEYWRRTIPHLTPSYKNELENSLVYQVLKIRRELPNFSIIQHLRNKLRINTNNAHSNDCSLGYSELYNIREDPRETRDLSCAMPKLTSWLKARLHQELLRTKDRHFPISSDPRSSPRLHNFTWTTWANNIRECCVLC